MEISDSKKYGKTRKPIQGTRAFMKTFKSGQDNISAASWIIVNDNYGTYTNVNLYNGAAGPGFDADLQTYPLKSLSQDKWRNNGYSETNIAMCSVAEKIESD